MADTQLESIGKGEAEYIAGEITKRDHEDNGNRSIIHPLTAVHFTDGDAPHYTVQSSWLQALCLRKLGRCNDMQLMVVAGAIMTATKKEDMKRAFQTAFDRDIGEIPNLNFYPADSGVDTCDVSLREVMRAIGAALQKVTMSKIGRKIIAKDQAFLSDTRKETRETLTTYRLKDGQRQRWEELQALLEGVSRG